MPKDTRRGMSPEWYACARCGKQTNLSLREHHRQEHQDECTVRFRGEAAYVLVLRGADKLWRCPRCAKAFAKSSRRIQDHARLGLCDGERPADAVMEEDVDGDEWEADEDYCASDDEDEDYQDDASDMGTKAANEKASLAASSRRLEPPKHLESSASARTRSKTAARSSQHLRASPATIQEMHPRVFEQVIAKLTAEHPHIRWNQPPLAVQAHVSSVSRLAASKPPVAPFEGPSAMPKREHREVLEASPVPVAAPPTPALKYVLAPKPSTPPESAPSEDSIAPEASSPEPDVPLDLQKFFATARISLHHLAPIFITRGYVTAAALDAICEEPEFWEEMKADIIAAGKLVSWLAAKKCLTERAKLLGATL